MVSIQCEFWAVGQGLFSSGKVICNGKPDFTWVYDCGSVKKSRSHLMSSIKQMRKSYQGDIDLLVLSHFDEDHISGVAELLKNKKVKYLVLPYFPLWKRLVLALEQGISVNSKLFSFYLNPVEYLWQECRDDFGADSHILLLQSIDDDVLDFPIKQLGEMEEQWEDLENDIIDLGIPVKLLPKGWSIARKGIEFIPYNAPLSALEKQPQDWDKFRQDIESILTNNTYAPQDLKNIKIAYDSEFTRVGKNSKKKSEDRNVISTFLYIGSKNAVPATVKYVENIKRVSLYEQRKTEFETVSCDDDGQVQNAILYTGDGYLETPEKFEHLKKVLGDKRMSNIFCFQALHHGSRKNWHLGLAQKISPYLTVFSADPDYANYKHPHSEVVKDFLPYSPVLVNQNSYLRFEIRYFFV